MKPRQYKAWTRAQKTARKLLIENDYLGAVLEQGTTKLRKNEPRLRPVFTDFSRMTRLIRANGNGQHFLERRHLQLAVATLLYFINPMDFIPDFTGPAGFVDDTLIILYALKRLRIHLEAFRLEEAEAERSSTSHSQLDAA